MKKYYLILVIFLIHTSLPCMLFASNDSIDIKNLYRKYNESVVTILSFDKKNQPLCIGSGFFAGEKNIIVTNYHVIKDAYTLKLKLSYDNVIEVDKICGLDIEHDIVLLKSQSKGELIPLTDKAPEIGDDIIAIGNPKGFERTLSRGIVSGIRTENGSIYYQITAPISPGSSGGPIINEAGHVIGVSTYFIIGGQNLNFSVPSVYIYKALKQKSDIGLFEASQIKIKKITKTIFEKFDASVVVVEPYIDGYGELEASILNYNNYSINNVKIIVRYFSDNHPVHFNLYNVKDIIPPNLAKRIKRKDDMLVRHGSNLHDKGLWKSNFTVYDYDIIENNTEKTTFELYPNFK